MSITIDNDYTITWTKGATALGDLAEASLFFRGNRVGFANADNYHESVREEYFWYTNNLHIEPEHRGKGLGVWLLLALSQAVRDIDPNTRLVPADWYGRNDPQYVRGGWGTTEDALRCWEKLGAPL